jgi:uncharacterized iron-regulated protein
MLRPAVRPALSSVLALLALTAACAGRQPHGPTLLHSDHPLAGRIWDVRGGRFVDETDFHAALARAHFVALGETHDNPLHHELQARALAAMIAAGRKPALAFEMLDLAQQPQVDAVLTRPLPHDPDTLAKAVGWAGTGWPDFALYRPVFATALTADLPIVAANLSRKQVREVVKSGTTTLAPEVRRLLERAGPLPEAAAQEIRDEMWESHCRELPRSMLDPFVTMQRARDAQLAERVLAARGDGAVLIAGSGHARTDRAVPSYLAREAPDRSRAAVAFLEVTEGRRTPADYAEAFGAGGLPFDYVVFTPAQPREDPCASFRAPKEQPAEPLPPGIDL